MLPRDLGQSQSAPSMFRGNISTGSYRTSDKNTTNQLIPIYGPVSTAFHNKTPSAPTTSFHNSASGWTFTSTYTDRLIPPRRGLNFEAVLYKLTHQSFNKITPYLDVIEQMKSLHTGWKKRLVTQYLNEIKTFQGINSKRIFQFNAQPSTFNPGGHYQKHTFIEGPSAIDVWKVKPRSKPLLNCWESAVELSGYVDFPNDGVIDWSSRNMILVAVEQEILIFKDTWVTKCASEVVYIEAENIGRNKIRCVKWNHRGDCFVIYSDSLKLCCYDVATSKVIWKQRCLCSRCSIRSVAWTTSDRQIITGCNRGFICIFNINGSCIERVYYSEIHYGSILDMVISPDDDYIATTGIDKNIRVHILESMVPVLEIGYFDTSEALAWHPWEKGVLCIGGGIGDGSLSLWDVPKQKSLGFRRVNFLSRVKHLAWNSLSGELVVVWYYWEGDTRLTTIPVLVSWNRIADAIIIQKNSDSLSFKHRIANIIWNPQHTRIGIQTADRLYLYNFFGDYSSEWEDPDKKKIRPVDQKSIFHLNSIR